MDSCPFNDEEIFHLCQAANVDHLQSREGNGRKVIKISSNLAVKFGLGVTLQEAHSQRYAFQKLNKEIVLVPRVHRFFTRHDSEFGSIGYLIMENIEGANLEQVDWEQLGLVPRVAAALNEVNSIRHTVPGPISGGEAHGCLWSEYGSGTAFSDIRHLESYLNERLAYFEKSIHLREEDLCLCHLDVTPRNFMIDLQGRLCLLDWASAGFFPRYFEIWSLEFAQHVIGKSFGQALSKHLKVTPREALQFPKLTLVYRYNSHYAV